MDDFGKRLKQDADVVQADVSLALRARIDASLSGVELIQPVDPAPRSPVYHWWAASLTGLAATIVVLSFVNWNSADSSVAAPLPDVARTVPLNPFPDLATIAPNLDIQTADFTSPLEEELLRLQSDIEKVRQSVREDIDFSF